MSPTTPVPAQVLDAPGVACVSLTPLIKRTITGLDSGEILEVRTDDPAARVAIPAWCRLTGNRLLDTIEAPGPDPTATADHTIFYIAAKEA